MGVRSLAPPSAGLALALIGLATAHAGNASRGGTLIGKLELPPAPERAAVATRGFLDRVENPLATVKPYAPASQMVIVLEGEEKPVSPPQITWDLVGESFARPIVAAPAGSEVVIKNVSRSARTLTALEDPKLLVGVINPTGPKSFRVTETNKVLTITDKDAPHLRGKVIVVNTQYIAYPDDTGRFEIAELPPGAYKLRIWYRDNWLDRPDDDITVGAKGKTDFNPKVPAGYPVKK